MRFQVPQFIEVEDKIFGPLTFKQFIYIAGGAGICVIFFSLLPKLFAMLLSAPIIALAIALAFYKVNERPFALLIEDFLKFHVGSKLYIWKKLPHKAVPKADEERPLKELTIPKLSQSKLKDLTFELDVKQQSNPVTRDAGV